MIPQSVVGATEELGDELVDGVIEGLGLIVGTSFGLIVGDSLLQLLEPSHGGLVCSFLLLFFLASPSDETWNSTTSALDEKMFFP